MRDGEYYVGLTSMKLTLFRIASMVVLLAGCGRENDQSLYQKEITIPPGKAHYKEFTINAGKPKCDISLRTTGEGRVNFAIIQREEFNAYKAGTGPVPVPIMSRNDVYNFDATSASLSRGEYLFSVHNFSTSPVSVVLKYKFLTEISKDQKDQGR